MKFKYKGVFLANRSSCSGFESSLNSWKENYEVRHYQRFWIYLQEIGKYLKQRCKVPELALQFIHIMLQTTSLKSLLIHMKINKVWTEISPDVHLASGILIAFNNMLNSSNDGLLFQILKGKAKFDSVHFVHHSHWSCTSCFFRGQLLEWQRMQSRILWCQQWYQNFEMWR